MTAEHAHAKRISELPIYHSESYMQPGLSPPFYLMPASLVPRAYSLLGDGRSFLLPFDKIYVHDTYHKTFWVPFFRECESRVHVFYPEERGYLVGYNATFRRTFMANYSGRAWAQGEHLSHGELYIHTAAGARHICTGCPYVMKRLAGGCSVGDDACYEQFTTK